MRCGFIKAIEVVYAFSSPPFHFWCGAVCVFVWGSVCVAGWGGGGVGVIYHTTSLGRQPSFLANLWSSLPACPTLCALPETDGSRNVLEQSSEELLVARKARERERERERAGAASFLTNSCRSLQLSLVSALICCKNQMNARSAGLLTFQHLGQRKVHFGAVQDHGQRNRPCFSSIFNHLPFQEVSDWTGIPAAVDKDPEFDWRKTLKLHHRNLRGELYQC